MLAPEVVSQLIELANTRTERSRLLQSLGVTLELPSDATFIEEVCGWHQAHVYMSPRFEGPIEAIKSALTLFKSSRHDHFKLLSIWLRRKFRHALSNLRKCNNRASANFSVLIAILLFQHSGKGALSDSELSY